MVALFIDFIFLDQEEMTTADVDSHRSSQISCTSNKVYNKPPPLVINQIRQVVMVSSDMHDDVIRQVNGSEKNKTESLTWLRPADPSCFTETSGGCELASPLLLRRPSFHSNHTDWHFVCTNCFF